MTINSTNNQSNIDKIEIEEIKIEQPLKAKVQLMGKETLKGISQGVTGPLVTTPIDNFQIRWVATKKPSIKSTFNGYGKVLMAVIPQKMASGAIFMSAVPVFSSLVSDVTDHKITQEIAPYALASMFEVGLTAPISRVVQTIRIDPDLNYINSTKSLIQIGGVRTLWKGAGPLALSSGVYNMLLFPTSKRVRNWIEADTENLSQRQALVNSFASGCITSVLITPITYPIHRTVIEQRANKEPHSFIKTTQIIAARGFKKAGHAGVFVEFYKGITPVFPRMFFLGGTMIMTGQAVENLHSVLVSLPTGDYEDFRENSHI